MTKTLPVFVNADTPGKHVVAGILAGGQGRRMGGQDKGLIPYGGRPLIRHVIARLAPQVPTLVINANRNLSSYRRFGYPVLADRDPDASGPLGGMLAVMGGIEADNYLFVPCDVPFVPLDLYARLSDALDQSPAAVVCARDAQRLHPTLVLMRWQVRREIEQALAVGERRLQTLFERVGMETVLWAGNPQDFYNVNRPGDLARSLPPTPNSATTGAM